MSCFKHLELLKTFSAKSASSSKKSGLEVDELLRSFRSNAESTSKKRKRHGQAESVVARTWCCPICEEKFDLENRQKASLKLGHHIRSKHTALWRKHFEENRAWRVASAGLQGNGAAHSLQVHQEGGPVARC